MHKPLHTDLDIDHRSKRTIMRMVETALAINRMLLRELFIADPDHPVSEGIPPEQQAAWRLERLARYSGTSQKTCAFEEQNA
jgi:hypothetical protein